MLDEPIDLSFKPVDATSSKRLSAEQIEQYNTHGFVRPFGIFDANEIKFQERECAYHIPH